MTLTQQIVLLAVFLAWTISLSNMLLVRQDADRDRLNARIDLLYSLHGTEGHHDATEPGR